MFVNRKHAGSSLAQKISPQELENPLVIGIPRGGIEVAAPLAQALAAPLYVILPRKLGAPFNREYAVGALAPDGTVSLDEDLISRLGLAREDLEPIITKESQEIQKRTGVYGPWGKLPDLAGRTVILVDDGIATGHTVKAALSSLRKSSAKKLLLAVPVLPEDAVSTFASLVDRLVYLEAPSDFAAVGQFYDDFSETAHQTVLDLLERTNKGLKASSFLSF